MFYPISIKKAFMILDKLPNSTDLEHAIRISQTVGISPSRAKIYIRALKKWGFIEGKEELKIKKLSFEEFVRELQQRFIDNLPPFFFEEIESINASDTSLTPELLSKKLSLRGIKISTWKIKLILSNLRAIGAIRIQRRIIPEESFRVNGLILNVIYENGCITARKLCKTLRKLTPYSTAEILARILSLLREGHIILEDLPHTLVGMIKNARIQNDLFVIFADRDKIRMLQEEIELSSNTRKLVYAVRENKLKINFAESEIRICSKIN